MISVNYIDEAWSAIACGQAVHMGCHIYRPDYNYCLVWSILLYEANPSFNNLGSHPPLRLNPNGVSLATIDANATKIANLLNFLKCIFRRRGRGKNCRVGVPPIAQPFVTFASAFKTGNKPLLFDV